MEKMTTKEIAKAVFGKTDVDVDVYDCEIDNRRVKPKSLFICIKGERFDGHDFAESAVEAGAVAVMCEKKLNLPKNISQILVENTSEAFLHLANYYRGKFTFPFIGVTGSVGKTTVKDMIHTLLSKKNKALKTEGNLNNEVGLPRTLMNIDSECEYAVIEMGMNHRGEISTLSLISQVDIGVINNIGTSHIGNLGSKENIMSAKLEILDGMKKGSPLVLNGDDKLLSSYKNDDYKVVFFGIENQKADYRAENIHFEDEFTSFDLVCSQGRYNIEIPLFGKHSVLNALAAFSVIGELKLNIDDYKDGLVDFLSTGMREKHIKIGDIMFIEDCYNASPDSVEASINTLASKKNHRKIFVFGDMLELGEKSKEAHINVGLRAAKKEIDMVLCIGIYSELTVAAAKANGVKISKSFDSKTKLADFLYENLQSGDVVTFKASRGMKLEEVAKKVYEKLEAEKK
ncbi:MAG: UDP-N-acetylmuramoyl-tripeptide--D-alanyl-D-alanine ligase [Clostridia bacterium]|nr:UDP-N-acetylmuramoyl-tripeptide--D-alanyl-D-alanine ligase [Clostridia bacterium]